MTQTTEENNETISISLSSLFIVLKREYKIILLVTLLFSIFGIFYVLSIPKEYISTGKIMPEVSYKASNGIAGINQLLKKYNGNVDLYNTEITSPELYAEILNTSDFYDYILTKEVTTRTNKKMSFKSYYDLNLENNKSFFQKEKSDFKPNDKIKYYNIIQDIQKRIIITTVKKNNLIFVTAQMQDPVVAANIANFTITYLIDYITKYRTEKARQELHFIENLQKNVSKDSTKKDALKEEIQNSLSTSIIQMKIKIQEDTPTIQVLEKAQISVVNNEPSISQLIGFIFLGFLIGVIVAFLRNHNYKTILISN
ncbi:Wzz/FepE/Etk N-terminal domain-containing protein [uncultured Flavobacterium sp.]|uniref:Wzz/FepE/Etk N-terminal domain-containing protein n=1 Tax=uncultured Flavobacterium sp. TaxID=165435 RepID=UPI00292F9A7B|nr:Wzz/FepE/Etk N-terminal domain-containing protein [uncultured Flavobacterium sp.]